MSKRYPGVSPFTSQQQHIFFGRGEDIKKLSKLIQLREKVLLYSKSGIGKTSLLNAGVMPKLENKFTALNIRFTAFSEEKYTPPVQKVIQMLLISLKEKFEVDFDKIKTPELDIFYEENGLEKNLWYYFKKLQLAKITLQGFKTLEGLILLVFDQFEELFSYPEKHITDFKTQFAELTRTLIPDNLIAAINKNITDIDEQDELIDLLSDKIELKTVFAIRSDRLSLLNQLSDKIPDIQEVYYELKPLNNKQVQEAIVLPAQEENADFETPAFTYSAQAIERIIEKLSNKGKQKIETTQLQIVCQRIEEISQTRTTTVETRRGVSPPHNETKHIDIVQTPHGVSLHNAVSVQITENDLPEFSDIFRNFYDNSVVTAVEEANKSGNFHTTFVHAFIEEIQVFIENHLIRNNQRISLDEIICHEHVDEELLKKLTDTHLLRAERNSTGGLSYELSHDTLVEPILLSKKEREEKEEEQRAKEENAEKLRLAEEQAEQERKEREKERKRQRKVILMVGSVAVVAIIAFIFAVLLYLKAESATENAYESERIAIKSNLFAEVEKKKALVALHNSKVSDSLTKIERNNALEEKRKADLAKTQAEQKSIEITKLLNKFVPDSVKNTYQFAMDKANDFMTVDAKAYKIDAYAEAIKFLSLAKYSSDKPNSVNISVIDKQIANLGKCPKLIEEGNKYFFENKFEKAKAIYTKVLQLNPKSKTAKLMKEFCKHPSQHFMVNVKAGKYKMSDDYVANLTKDYSISAYEITNAQYARFLNEYKSTNIKEGDYKEQSMIRLSGSSGFVKCRIQEKNGNYTVENGYECFPVVYVSWYGANEYAQFYQGNLPSEAQWEYAAAGGQEMAKNANGIYEKEFTYAGGETIEELAWFDDNSEQREHFVGTKKANQLGLYDMSGNLYEWCYDWYGDYPSGEIKNYQGVEKSSDRVLRGGSWDVSYNYCRVAYRSWSYPYYWVNYFGFRLLSTAH